MTSVSKTKVIGKGHKACARCGKDQPFTQYYTRPTYGTLENPAIEPGHFISECKTCMFERAKHQKRLPPWKSRVKHEQMTIDYLMRRGIWTTTGKMTNAPDVDLVSLGVVWLEAKYAEAKQRGLKTTFSFTFTPSQQERGFLAHVVVLICAHQDGRHTFHFFQHDDPVFYKDDGVTMKSAVTFTIGKRVASIRGRGYQHQITQQLMDSRKDDVSLIWTWAGHIHKALLSGVQPEYGKPFARDWTPPAVSAKNPVA